jgi:predicted permease
MGSRGFLAAAGVVVMATLVALVIVLLIDVNNLTDQVTVLEGATASAQNTPQLDQLQSSVDAANQGIGAVTLAIQSMQNSLPHYKITCASVGAGDVESCVISPPS